MGRSIFRQDTQVRKSEAYVSNISPTLANFQTTPVSLEDDLSVLRSGHHRLLNKQTGNWYDDLNVPSSLENGTQRAVNDLNSALHLLEKKRVLRDVWKLLDVFPGLDLAITLANDIKAKYNLHIPHLTYHPVADTVNGTTAANATSLATAITLANELKADYNAHRVEATVHSANDTTNIVTAANASNLANLITLLNDLRVQYEAHRVSAVFHLVADTVNTISAPTIGSTTQVHIFTAAQLPLQTLLAIGAVTTLGTVAAQATTFGTAGLDEVVSTSDINPKNMMMLVDAVTHLDPILVGGKQLFALFQSESATDGSTATDTTPNRVQLSFVVRNTTGDDLELVSVPVTQGFNFATRERMRLEGLDEQDFLKGATIEFPASTAVTRQIGYDNQGVTPVELATHAYLDLGIGLEWHIRDVLNATLLKAVEGSGSAASTIQLTGDVDVFDINAVLNDFLNGIKVDTGSAGTTIQVGVTPNQIDSGGALAIATAAAGQLKLASGGQLALTDQWEPVGWSIDGIQLSDAAAEWTAFETAFGEVSLLNAIVQAKSAAYRRRVFSVCTVTAPAGNDVSGPSNDNNLDTDLGSLAAGTFTEDYDLYLNGQYLRPGATSLSNHDFYPGTSLAAGQLAFEFVIRVGDQLCLIDRTP